eukprot:gene6801-8438_t
MSRCPFHHLHGGAVPKTVVTSQGEVIDGNLWGCQVIRDGGLNFYIKSDCFQNDKVLADDPDAKITNNGGAIIIPLSNMPHFLTFRETKDILEFSRLGIVQGSKTSQWSISTINTDYGFCETYPKYLVVPSFCNDKEILNKVASFRTSRRIPALSWRHKIKNSVIIRSSQPKTGWQRTRSKEDELLISMFRMAANPHNQLVVMDARPKMNAVANHARGAGYENVQCYENTEIVFLGIENIHAMKESYRRLREVVLSQHSDASHWYSNLENTHWLDHILLLLDSSRKVAELIEEETSVLVHCSDGWDRTSQICSLSMLLLDPYYRSLEGFQILIEKEWLSFGHMFYTRTHGKSIDERSPIFMQFVDCVWQLTNQFPHAFEFNEKLLIRTLDALYSCQFGTFLYDCEKERMKAANLPSFWSYVDQNRSSFLNPLYVPQPPGSVLLPATEIKFIRFWDSYYCGSFSPMPTYRMESLVSWNHDNNRLISGLKQELVNQEKEKQTLIQRSNDYLQESTKLHQTIEDLQNEIKIKDTICENRQSELLQLRKEKDSLLLLLEKSNNNKINGSTEDKEEEVEQQHQQQELEEEESTKQKQHAESLLEFSISSLQSKISKLEFEVSKIQIINERLTEDGDESKKQIVQLQKELNENRSMVKQKELEVSDRDQQIREQDLVLQEKLKYISEQEKMYFILKKQVVDLDLQLQEIKSKNSNMNGGSSPFSSSNYLKLNSTKELPQMSGMVAFGARDIVDVVIHSSNIKKTKSKPDSTVFKGQDINNIEIIDDYILSTDHRNNTNGIHSSTSKQNLLDNNGINTSSSSGSDDNLENGDGAGAIVFCTGCSKEVKKSYIKGKKGRVHCPTCEKDYQTLKQRNRRCTKCEKVLDHNLRIIDGNRYCSDCINMFIEGIQDLGF